jgi:hypothetical protein
MNQYSNSLYNHNDIWQSQNISNVSFPVNAHEILIQFEENSFWFKHRNNCIIELVNNFATNKTIFE